MNYSIWSSYCKTSCGAQEVHQLQYHSIARLSCCNYNAKLNPAAITPSCPIGKKPLQWPYLVIPPLCIFQLHYQLNNTMQCSTARPEWLPSNHKKLPLHLESLKSVSEVLDESCCHLSSWPNNPRLLSIHMLLQLYDDKTISDLSSVSLTLAKLTDYHQQPWWLIMAMRFSKLPNGSQVTKA